MINTKQDRTQVSDAQARDKTPFAQRTKDMLQMFLVTHLQKTKCEQLQACCHQLLSHKISEQVLMVGQDVRGAVPEKMVGSYLPCKDNPLRRFVGPQPHGWIRSGQT
jgi:hypothetical protein